MNICLGITKKGKKCKIKLKKGQYCSHHKNLNFSSNASNVAIGAMSNINKLVVINNYTFNENKETKIFKEISIIEIINNEAKNDNYIAKYALFHIYENQVLKDDEYEIKSLNMLIESAKEYKYAQYDLGRLYEEGKRRNTIIININLEKAYKYFLKSAINGLPEAQNHIAYYYYEGINKVKDEDKGIEWYNKAAYNGNIIAQHKIINLEKNSYKKLCLIKKFADMRNMYLQCYLINYYYNEEEYEKCYNYCIKYENMFYSNFILSILYEDKLLNNNTNESIYYYNKGLELYKYAINEYKIYKYILDILCFYYYEEEYDKVVQWLPDDVEFDHIKGIMFFYNKGYNYNYKKSYKYLLNVINFRKNGDIYEYCNYLLGIICFKYKISNYELYFKKSGTLEKYGIMLINNLENNKITEAQRYEFGLGVERNLEKSFELYKEENNEFSEIKLRYFYMFGIGTKPDIRFKFNIY